MKKPAVVVFDLGKVLLDFDYGRAAQRIAARSQFDAPAVRQLIDHSPLLFRYETGLMTRIDFFDEIRAAIGFKGDLKEFVPLFTDIFQPIDDMVALAAELQGQNVPTFILSNTNDMAIDHIRRAFPFFGTFQGYILSYEHRAMKPDPRLYKVVEKQAGAGGDQILFLDDRPENVDAAAQLGWSTIQHVSPGPTRARFKKLGLVE